jgi:Superfamily II DNA and RNA helicases
MNLLFEGLGLSEELVLHLETLGFTEPTPIQVQAIPHLLAGRDVVGQAQTGTGKTAAFSLPILERIDLDVTAVQALVLTPTRELAMQVTEAIRDLSGISGDGPVKVGRSVQVLTVYGGQSIDRQMQRLKRGVHVVVGTPGRILDMLSRGSLKLDKVKWLVLDEADEMLAWALSKMWKKSWMLHQKNVKRHFSRRRWKLPFGNWWRAICATQSTSP